MTEPGTHLITISQAIAADACTDGVRRMRARLHEACPDASAAELDAIPFAIGDVALVSLNDALWCLRLVDDRRTIVRAIMPTVKRASTHTSDPRVHDCIAAIERWLDGGDGADLGHAARGARAARAAANEFRGICHGVARQGVGIDGDIATASLKAIISGVNRAIRG